MSTAAPTWPLAPQPWEPASNRPEVTIRDVRAICTAPEGIRLIVVKIETSEPGLFGLGCATFTQRPKAVVDAIETYLKPMILGRDPNDIEDIYQSCYLSSYWRTGPIMNNALSGVDQALWDIKGKLANMPVYQLLGGKTRRAATVYTHASADSIPATVEAVRAKMDAGFTHVRAQVAVPGYHTYGAKPDPNAKVQQPWHEAAYVRIVPKLFDALRTEIGDEVELLHDIHERDSSDPGDQSREANGAVPAVLPRRSVCARGYWLVPSHARGDLVPIAMGELFVNQTEWEPLIKERLIDFIRVHISAIGGLSHCPQAGALLRIFRCPHGLARPWRCLASGPCRQPASRPRQHATSESRKRISLGIWLAKCSPVRLKFATGKCGQTTNQAWGSIWTRRLPPSIRSPTTS